MKILVNPTYFEPCPRHVANAVRAAKRAGCLFVDLRNADLQNADLRNAWLQDADLRNANLRNVTI